MLPKLCCISLPLTPCAWPLLPLQVPSFLYAMPLGGNRVFLVALTVLLTALVLQVPSFLYAMPLGGNRVFLEETCLVARPPMPFATLKRRLERRCKALGIKVGRELGWCSCH